MFDKCDYDLNPNYPARGELKYVVRSAGRDVEQFHTKSAAANAANVLSEQMPRKVIFYRVVNGTECVVGSATRNDAGWKFYPLNQRHPSRKFHATLAQCLPSWLVKSGWSRVSGA